MVWRIFHVAFNIYPPNSLIKLFGNWLRGVTKKLKAQFRVGVCALLWAIWNVRNNYIFNRAQSYSFMQVVPLATHYRMWSYLQPTEKRAALATGCNQLESVARDLYNQCSWRFDRRTTFMSSFFRWLIHISTLCDP